MEFILLPLLPAAWHGYLRSATHASGGVIAAVNVFGRLGREWGQRLAGGEATSVDNRITHMFLKALTREPTDEELTRVAEYVRAVATDHETSPDLLMYGSHVWQDVAHSLFNLKEFIFIP